MDLFLSLVPQIPQVTIPKPVFSYLVSKRRPRGRSRTLTRGVQFSLVLTKPHVIFNKWGILLSPKNPLDLPLKPGVDIVVRQLIDQGVAPAARSVYLPAWRRYTQFCGQHSLAPLSLTNSVSLLSCCHNQ